VPASELPTGTVTFLFTDIESSTSRWEHHPETMMAALARHHVLLHEAIAAHGGRVFQVVGDGFCVAFATAPAAVAAADAAQAALHAEPWDAQIGPLRVRMALYTGTAEAAGDDYRSGPPLNRVSRLLSTGHGGQVLIAQTVHGLVHDALPPGATLLDHGEHPLRDLSRPERIYQLLSPRWPADRRPLKTLATRPNNLTAQPTPLVDRTQDVESLRQLLSEQGVRLVTLIGPGGTGKTRLSLQVAADLLDQFESGVYFVALAPIDDPTLVAATIAQALRVPETAGQPLLETLKSHLAGQRLLLVLDNFEQLMPAAPLLAELLLACAELKLLVTSRAGLHLRGEREYPVPPLALPDPRELPPAEQLSQYAAVELFVQRALAVQPDFAVTNQNAAAVAEICARLDGLPLAIELAAARIKLLPPQAILARLEHRLQILTGGSRELPARQQTLRGAIGWSYDLLSPAEQMLFRRLAVFVDGCTLEAAAAVCGDDLGVDLLDGMGSLVDKSLLRPAAAAGDSTDPRFAMLQTIREYALECLVASAEAGVVRERHARYYLQLAEAADLRLGGAEQSGWLERLETEHANFREALVWSLAPEGAAALGVQLAGALWHFWWAHGHLSEGRRWLEATLPRGTGAPAAARARALHGLGNFALPLGDYPRALACYEEALALRRELGDQAGSAMLLNNLGFLAQDRGDSQRAMALHEEALALRRAVGDQAGIALSLYNLGDIARDGADYPRAVALLEESLALRRAEGDTRGIAASLQTLGDVARCQGQYGRAVELLDESLRLLEEIGDKLGRAASLDLLAAVALDQGDDERATALATRSLDLWRELENKLGIATAQRILGDLACRRGDTAEASKLLADSLALFRALGTKLGIALALHRLALAAGRQGDWTGGAARCAESLALRWELGEQRGVAECLEGLGLAAVAVASWRRAARLFGTAESLRSAIGAPLPPAEQAPYVRALAATRAALGAGPFNDLLASARSGSLDEAIREALEPTAARTED
jgi:predicted ATPase/class 3 adenylate cyclase